MPKNSSTIDFTKLTLAQITNYALQDDREARYFLAKCYRLGFKTELDIHEAQFWFEQTYNEITPHKIVQCTFSNLANEIKNLTTNTLFAVHDKKTSDFEKIKKALKAFDDKQISVEFDFSRVTNFTEIEDEAFFDCFSLVGIKLPNKITRIGNRAFAFTSLKEIDLPETVTEIGYGAFYGCYSLTRISELKNISKIGESAFDCCDKLVQKGTKQTCILCKHEFIGESACCPMCLGFANTLAKAGYAREQYMLGKLYLNGYGVYKIERLAFIWFSKSAEQGYAKAQFELYKCYKNGIGVKKNKTKALFWLEEYTNSTQKLKRKIIRLKNKETETNTVAIEETETQDLDSLLANITETWQQRINQRIEKASKKPSEVYKKAHLSKQLFSKIRSEKTRSLEKETAFALAIGLELDLNETKDFLAETSHAFSDINPVDVIVRDFISKKEYDIIKINEALEKRNLPLLGDERNDVF